MDADERENKRPRMRRQILIGAGATIGAAVLGDLAWKKTHPRKTVLQPDGQARSLTIAWPSPEDDLILIVARERGFFEHYNLDITTQPCITGRQAITILANEKVCGAVSTALAWLPALHGGVPARLVSGLGAGTYRLLVRRDAGITRIDSVVGKTIAVLNEDAGDQRFFSILLRRKGIDPANVHWVPVSEDRIDQALAARDVDGVVLHDPDGWQLLSENPKMLTELAGSTTGNYAARVNKMLGLSNRFLAEDPKGAAALVLALRDACRWIEKHRDETAALLAPHIPDMDDDEVRRMLAHEPAPVHLLVPWLRDQVAEYADELKLLDLLPDALDSGAFARSVCRNVLHA
ncbi:ABC transporter substrate-binding protein [Acetobacter conturbans]|uniref:ABC transporter substrate-binding protein n=1 Tax=Acetobacter conturbans TaxID=1737472 RepID=A0ABX0JZP6_9PROT|nr:ABC transporter substrate-binding protein [Acetobacter conturbans]NHN88967.1 ABC transporter substrate-binding protein [Acetobacter conturbans]